MEKQSYISEGCLTGVGRLLGEPFSYASEKNGELIHNICPVQGYDTIQCNGSSGVDLSFHETRPDYLALYCLRQDHEKRAFTRIVDIRSVVATMDPGDVKQLQRPLFIVPSPQSHHTAMGGEKWSSPRPLFNTFEDPNFLCHFPGMKALDPQAQSALDSFQDAILRRSVVRSIALQPGCILLINNRKVAHGRTLFEAHYDGVDRWLQRVYIKSGRGTNVVR